MELQQVKAMVEQRRGEFLLLQREKDRKTLVLEELIKEQLRVEQAREIINLVAQKTQTQLEEYISDVVTSALEIVFNEPYKFHIEFVQRRNKTEADLFFTKGEHRISPLDASGGGVINVADFALRVGLLMLSTNRKVLILDEPFNFLHSKVFHQRVANLLEVISKQTGIQIIMITGKGDSEEIISKADKVFKVVKSKGISKVEELVYPG